MVTDINLLDINKTYSYADYLTWQFPERVELYKGRVSIMDPVTYTVHQMVSVSLIGNSFEFFKQRNCYLFPAPFDVRLLGENKSIKDEDVNTVVQPDLCVYCDKNKLDERGGIGAPDLVVEILASENVVNELKYKFKLYEEAGVKEYWIVSPSEMNILIYVLEENKFIGMHPLTDEDSIQSRLFPELDFRLEDIFKGIEKYLETY